MIISVAHLTTNGVDKIICHIIYNTKDPPGNSEILKKKPEPIFEPFEKYVLLVYRLEKILSFV